MKKAISLCLFFLLCGCLSFSDSPPSQFYMLETLPAEPFSQAKLNIGIQEVQIPETLRTSPESLRTTNGRDVRTLNQLLLFPVVLTKFFRRASLLLFEDPVEVGKIIESALIADFGY